MLGSVQAYAAFPDKPIRMVVASAPGTAPDQVARLLQPGLEKRLKQSIIIENKVGANGIIAVNYVLQGKPDGYTILAATAGTFVANPTLYHQSGGGKIVDFEPIAMVAATPLTLSVRAGLGVKSCPDLLALIRSQPGKLNLASSTQGSFTHLAAEMLKRMGKLDFHIIPFQGAVAGANSLAGGHSDIMIESMGILAPLVESGHLVALATTGATRDPLLPQMMTLEECGVPGYGLSGWAGLAAPKGTDKAAIDAISRAVEGATKDPEFIKSLTAIKWTPAMLSPAEFAREIAKERKEMEQTIQEANIKVQ